MLFIPIPPTPTAILDKIQKDSGKDFSAWPKDADQPGWLRFNGTALRDLHGWLSGQCAQKVKFADEEADQNRRALGLATAKDYEYYEKVFNLLAPYLAGKPTHPYPKFSARSATEALTGFTNANPEDQPAVFEVVEENLTLNGTLTPDHLINVLLTFTDGERVFTSQYNFQVPLNTAPLHFKPLLLKYLTDRGFTYAEGGNCFNAYVADQKERDSE